MKEAWHFIYFAKLQKYVVRHKKKFGAAKKTTYFCRVILNNLFTLKTNTYNKGLCDRGPCCIYIICNGVNLKKET